MSFRGPKVQCVFIQHEKTVFMYISVHENNVLCVHLCTFPVSRKSLTTALGRSQIWRWLRERISLRSSQETNSPALNLTQQTRTICSSFLSRHPLPPPSFPWETCKYKDPETHVVSHKAANVTPPPLVFSPSLCSAPSLDLLTQETNPQEGGREGEKLKNRKTTKNKNKECWRGSQHWETDLIACVWKAKEKRDKLATGSQEKKKKTELLWAPADCKAFFLTMVASSCARGGHVGPSVSGMWDEEHKQGKTGPLQSSLGDDWNVRLSVSLFGDAQFPSEAATLRPQLSTFSSNLVSSHHQGRLA